MSGVQITLERQFLLFGQYCDIKRSTFTREESSLACEAVRRFQQLELLLGRIYKLESRLHEVFVRPNANDAGSRQAQEAIARSIDTISLELITFVEAFYYFAWRLREVLRQLPGLKKFDAPGIRYVRNHLIEHPEKKSHLLRQAFAFDPKQGPVLKPINKEQRDPKVSDKGLWENVRELQEVLDRSLSKAAKHTQHV